MLGIHGIAIIAREVYETKNFQYKTLLKFDISTGIQDKDMIRHRVHMFVKKDDVEQFTNKIKRGKVCVIYNAKWHTWFVPKDENKKYSPLIITIKPEQFDVLKPCIYNSEFPNITKQEK